MNLYSYTISFPDKCPIQSWLQSGTLAQAQIWNHQAQQLCTVRYLSYLKSFWTKWHSQWKNVPFFCTTACCGSMWVAFLLCVWEVPGKKPQPGDQLPWLRSVTVFLSPSSRQKLVFTYLLTPWSRVLLEKLTGSQLVKKLPAFYRTHRFITTFTSAHHLFLSWARSIQSTPPHPTSRRPILILSSHLRLGLPSGLFLSGFPTKIMYTPLLSPIHATCPTHLILLDSITQTILIEEYKLLSFSLCSFLHSLLPCPS